MHHNLYRFRLEPATFETLMIFYVAKNAVHTLIDIFFMNAFMIGNAIWKIKSWLSLLRMRDVLPTWLVDWSDNREKTNYDNIDRNGQFHQHFLRVAFVPIFLRQKRTNIKCEYKKGAWKTSVHKSRAKQNMVKLTPGLKERRPILCMPFSQPRLQRISIPLTLWVILANLFLPQTKRHKSMVFHLIFNQQILIKSQLVIHQ